MGELDDEVGFVDDSAMTTAGKKHVKAKHLILLSILFVKLSIKTVLAFLSIGRASDTQVASDPLFTFNELEGMEGGGKG